MIKYITVAVGLKGFSCGSPMRRLYRTVGNHIGGRKRATGRMSDYYAKRIRRMLRLAKQYGVVQNGDRVLELGTGWCHWEALTSAFLILRPFCLMFGIISSCASLKNYLSRVGRVLEVGRTGWDCHRRN